LANNRMLQTVNARKADTGILTAYFARLDEARLALRDLGRRGFRRAALINKTADGRARTLDPFPRRRALVASLAAVLLGGIAGAAALFFHVPESIADTILTPLIPILAAGSLGAILGVVGMQRSRYGVNRRLLAEHVRRLASEETVLILQARIDLMKVPAAVLRETGEIRADLMDPLPGKHQTIEQHVVGPRLGLHLVFAGHAPGVLLDLCGGERRPESLLPFHRTGALGMQDEDRRRDFSGFAEHGRRDLHEIDARLQNQDRLLRCQPAHVLRQEAPVDPVPRSLYPHTAEQGAEASARQDRDKG
jgi:hypothetical protein